MSLPFRLYCGPIKNYRGCCFNHQPTTDTAEQYTNTTAVDNWDTGTGGTIPPYERWTPDDGGDCTVHHCVTTPPSPPCSQWLRPFTNNVYTDSGSVIDFGVIRKRGFKNVMARRAWSGRFGYKTPEAGDGPDTVESCDGVNTFSKRRKYVATAPSTKYLTLTVAAESQEQQYIGGTPTVNWDDTAGYVQSIDADSGLLSISDFSASPGYNTVLGTVNDALLNAYRAHWYWADIVNRMTNPLRSPFGGGSTTSTDTTITITAPVGLGGSLADIEVVTWDLSAGTFERYLYSYDGSGTQHVDTHETVSVSDSTIHWREEDFTYSGSDLASSAFIDVTGTLSGSNTMSGLYADVKDLLAQIPLNDDKSYPWRTDLKVNVAPLVCRDELVTNNFTVECWIKDYGDPITGGGGETIGDIGWNGWCGLIANPSSDTGIMIVAIDLNVNASDVIDQTVSGFDYTTITGYNLSGTLPPGISFDSSTGHLSGTVTTAGHYGVTIVVTGASPKATGNILGVPKPAGYINYFNFGFIDMWGCCYRPPDNPGHQTWSWYQRGWGMDVDTFNTNTGCHLPRNSTNWNNWWEAINKPQGAWIFHADKGNYYPASCISSDAGSQAGDAGYLVACKYAECLENWPSQNFAKPAGAMKFWYDENRVYCAVNVSGTGEGSTWTITDVLSGLAPDDGTDFSGIWGGPAMDGFYAVTSYSGGTLTLGAKSFDLPSDWESKSEVTVGAGTHDRDFCFGKLRWSDKPSLLGRAEVAPDTAGVIFTFTEGQPSFGMDSSSHQEQVDIFDVNMNQLFGDITATRVDDNTFSIGFPVTSAKYVTIHGAAKWYMNDYNPKGDYAVLTWHSDFRTPGEVARLAGVLDCSGTPETAPTANAGGGPADLPFRSFSQTAACLPFSPCSPQVVCISPNGETWPNGTTYDFPASFYGDETYGAKWWGFVQTTMTDLYWQKPHRPCNVKPCAQWLQDGGICADNNEGSCPGDEDYIVGESPTPMYYYAHPPQVEPRLDVPCTYGDGSECTSVPAGIQVGWLSPVNYSSGDVAYPPEPPLVEEGSGVPNGASTAWDLYSAMCAVSGSCRFDYTLPKC